MVKAATEEYRMEEDSLQQFMSERVIEMPGAHFPMRDLFTEYKNWCGRLRRNVGGRYCK